MPPTKKGSIKPPCEDCFKSCLTLELQLTFKVTGIDYSKVSEHQSVMNEVVSKTKAIIASEFQVSENAIVEYVFNEQTGAVKAGILTSPTIDTGAPLVHLAGKLNAEYQLITNIGRISPNPAAINLDDTTLVNGPGEPGITFISAQVSAGATSVQANSVVGFSVGDTIMIGEEIQQVTKIDGNTLAITSPLNALKKQGTPVRFIQEAPIVMVFELKNLVSSKVMASAQLKSGIKDSISDLVITKLTVISAKAFDGSATGGPLSGEVKGAFIDVELFAPFGTNMFASITIAPHEGRIITQFDSVNLNTAIAGAIQDNVDNINDAKTNAANPVEISAGETISTVGTLAPSADSLLQSTAGHRHHKAHHKARDLSKPSQKKELALMQVQSVERVKMAVNSAEDATIVYFVEARNIGMSLSEASHKRREINVLLRDRLRSMNDEQQV
jgi:hypothetical protein